jgi:hypothetical protein
MQTHQVAMLCALRLNVYTSPQQFTPLMLAACAEAVWPDSEKLFMKYPGARPGERPALHIQVSGSVAGANGMVSAEPIGSTDVSLVPYFASTAANQVWHQVVNSAGVVVCEVLVSAVFQASQPAAAGSLSATLAPTAARGTVSVASGEWGEATQVADSAPAAVVSWFLCSVTHASS